MNCLNQIPSFNSPKGMCPKCKGLSFLYTINREKVIPNNKVSIENGGIEPLGEKKTIGLLSS